MNKYLEQLWPLIIGFIIVYLIHTETAVTIVTLAVIIATFKIKCEKNEIKWLLIGIIIGILLEIGGDLFYKLQFWSEGSFFGIPLWLPLFWGYVFVIVRRVGNIVVKK